MNSKVHASGVFGRRELLYRQRWLLVLGLIVWAPGCQSLKLDAPLSMTNKKKLESPEKIMAVWTDAIRNQSGQPGQRGFGGRVFFYGADEKPIKVEGAVSIYLFDDDRTTVSDTAPEMRFVFPAETLENHYSKCPLGHSYSFWVSLGEVGGPTRNLSLVTRFDNTQGSSVVSSITRKILPGLPSSLPAEPQKVLAGDSDEVQLVGYSESDDVQKDTWRNNKRKASNALTIDLPPSFTQRLQQFAPDSTTGPAQPARPEPTFLDAINGKEAPNSIESEPRSELLTPQAPSEQSLRPTANLPRHQPHRAMWQSALPPTPRSGFQTGRRSPFLPETALEQRAEQFFQEQAQIPVAGQVHEENWTDDSAADD